MKIDKMDLAYLGGVLDTWGNFSIYVVKKSKTNEYITFKSCLIISTKFIEIIDWINNLMPTIKSIRTLNKNNPKRDVVYVLNITGNDLTDLLTLVIPYMKFRKELAELVLQFRKTFPKEKLKKCRRVEQEIYNIRSVLHEEFKNVSTKYNKKGCYLPR